jgi:hypothetical protein
MIIRPFVCSDFTKVLTGMFKYSLLSVFLTFIKKGQADIRKLLLFSMMCLDVFLFILLSVSAFIRR